MQPTNNFNHESNWAKWFVSFAVLLLVGAGITGLALSGIINPEKQAIADGINKQNTLNYQKGLVDLEQYSPLKQVETQALLAELIAKPKRDQARHEQELDQRERAFQNEERRKDETTTWLARAMAFAIIILALAGGYALIIFVKRPPLAQPQVATMLKGIGEINTTTQNIQRDSTQILERQKQLEPRVVAVEAAQREARVYDALERGVWRG